MKSCVSDGQLFDNYDSDLSRSLSFNDFFNLEENINIQSSTLLLQPDTHKIYVRCIYLKKRVCHTKINIIQHLAKKKQVLKNNKIQIFGSLSHLKKKFSDVEINSDNLRNNKIISLIFPQMFLPKNIIAEVDENLQKILVNEFLFETQDVSDYELFLKLDYIKHEKQICYVQNAQKIEPDEKFYQALSCYVPKHNVNIDNMVLYGLINPKKNNVINWLKEWNCEIYNKTKHVERYWKNLYSQLGSKIAIKIEIHSHDIPDDIAKIMFDKSDNFYDIVKRKIITSKIFNMTFDVNNHDKLSPYLLYLIHTK